MTDVTPTFRRTTYPTISPSAPSNDQSGRTVLVTGASEGVGYSIALSFAAAHAARVILVSRTQAKLDKAAQTISQAHPDTRLTVRACDVSDTAQIAAFWTWLAGEGVSVDVLVLNAAYTAIAPSTLDEITKHFQFGVIANAHMFDHFSRQPDAGGRPRCLIALSSAALQCYPFPEAAYGAAKAGFANYLGHVADDTDPAKMRIMIMHPGAVYTAAAERADMVTPDLPIWDNPSLCGHFAVWLAGADAAFLHGRVLWANWDADELMGMKAKLEADKGFLRIGVQGAGSFDVNALLEKCDKAPLPKD